jgi:hypothetical protein
MNLPGTINTAVGTSHMQQGFASRSTPPAFWFAGFGVLCTVYGLYAVISWLLSPDVVPIDPGPDPLPEFSRWLILLLETVGVVGAVAMLIYGVRSIRRAGKMTFEAALVFGFALCYWQDPMINWYRPIFFYNSHFLNFGNWSPYLPGWISPGAKGLPEPLLGMGLAYIYAGVWIAVAIRGAMRMARKRRPQITTLQLIGVAMLTGMLMDLIIEATLVRQELWAYPGAVGWLTLWAGETYQFPIYESIFWGPVWGTFGALYYFRDDRGYAVTERGLDRVQSAGMHGALRLFAMVGVINLCFVLYNASMMWMSFYVDSTPKNYPSYLLNGMCGKATGYDCPGPGTPVYLPGQPPIPGIMTGDN